MENLDDILSGEGLNTLNVKATTDELNQLSKLANELIHKQNEVKGFEESIKDYKFRIRQIAEQEIPDLLAEVGLSSFELKDGTKIKVEPFVTAHISKDRANEAHAWLEQNGFGELIKREVASQFGRGDNKYVEVMSALDSMGQSYTTKEGVHHATLKSFAREQMEKGTDIPVTLFGLYSGFTTKISKS
tara:strand:+ start:2821 stop:3384 length:564 start_codon:yes stop_codon:yes gene_type:complete